MGAGISSMVAGAWPDRVGALLLLEGIGMNTKVRVFGEGAGWGPAVLSVCHRHCNASAG